MKNTAHRLLIKGLIISSGLLAVCVAASLLVAPIAAQSVLLTTPAKPTPQKAAVPESYCFLQQQAIDCDDAVSLTAAGAGPLPMTIHVKDITPLRLVARRNESAALLSKRALASALALGDTPHYELILQSDNGAQLKDTAELWQSWGFRAPTLELIASAD
jgi:hypothetical protein